MSSFPLASLPNSRGRVGISARAQVFSFEDSERCRERLHRSGREKIVQLLSRKSLQPEDLCETGKQYSVADLAPTQRKVVWRDASMGI